MQENSFTIFFVNNKLNRTLQTSARYRVFRCTSRVLYTVHGISEFKNKRNPIVIKVNANKTFCIVRYVVINSFPNTFCSCTTMIFLMFCHHPRNIALYEFRRQQCSQLVKGPSQTQPFKQFPEWYQLILKPKVHDNGIRLLTHSFN